MKVDWSQCSLSTLMSKRANYSRMQREKSHSLLAVYNLWKKNAELFESSNFLWPFFNTVFLCKWCAGFPCMGHTLVFLLINVIDCNGTILHRAWSGCFAEFECPTTGLLQVNRKKVPVSLKSPFRYTLAIECQYSW